MVGRHAELQLLRDAWQHTVAGAPPTVVVRGPEGAGASRLAAALAEEVARDGYAVATADDGSHDQPWLMVATGPVDRPPRSMLLRLAGTGSPVAADEQVVDLGPLSTDEVHEVVAGYVPATQVEQVTREVLGNGPAWPGRVHAEASRLARAAATRRLASAVDVAGQTSARMASARDVVSESIVTLGEGAALQRSPLTTGTCPWRGLASYGVEDAPWFAGREHLVAELLARLTTTRLLALVGASGSGKSSALRAGVLAALREDALPGSGGWRQVLMRPGRHPMRELARAALGSPGVAPGDLLAHLVRIDDEVPRTLVVVDQMEEVWTACDDPGERTAFLDTLVGLLDETASATTLLLAIRADYVAAAAEHSRLAALMADGTVLVGSPTPAEVERAVTRPAARAGLVLEDGLAQTVVDDAGAEPGVLPLLSVALTQLWQRRVGERLTFAGYVSVGGIAGAIGTLAEDVWSGLSEQDREIARVLLLRLAGPGEGTVVVRRRVPLREVEALALPGLHCVLDRLATARLITLGDGHVEVAHEALFREWPRLRGWLSDDVAGRAVQRRLAIAAAEWDAEGREPAALWRGTRLQSGLEVASARPEEVTHVERDFLAAGRQAAEAEKQEIRERAEAAARQNSRLRLLVLGTAVLLVLALIAGLVALRARSAAQKSAAQAQASAVSAEARRLAADALNEDRPAVGLLEAIESIRREGNPETYGALLTLLTRTPDIATRYRIADRFLRIGAAADGSTVHLADNTVVLHTLDAVTGEELWTATTPGEDAQWGAPVSHSSGRWLAVPVLGDPEHDVLAFLDPRTGELLRTVSGTALARAAPGATHWLDENAHVLGSNVVVTSASHLFLIDSATGRVRRALPFGPHLPFSTLLPDGRLAAPVDDTSTRLIDPRTGRQRVHNGVVVGVSADGRQIITANVSASTTGAEFSSLQLRSPRWRPVGRPVLVQGYVREAVFLPRGEVAVALDEVIQVHRADTLEQERTLEGHSGAVLGIELAGPDRDLLWTAGRDGTAVAFDLSGARGVLRTLAQQIPADAGTATADVGVLVEHYDDRLNTVRMVDLSTGRDLHGEQKVLPGCLCQPTAVALSPDGRTAVTGVVKFTDGFADVVTDSGSVVVWDVRSGARTRTITTPWEATGVGVTPDGRHVVVNGRGGWGRWDLTTGLRVWVAEDPTRDDEPLGLVGAAGMTGISPDGTSIVLARNEEVLLLDADTGEVVQSTRLAGARILSDVVWSDDGNTVVLGSLSGRLYFLHGTTLARVAPERLVTAGFVLDLAVSPDGRMLAVMGSDGDVTLFDTDTWRPYGKPVVDGLGWGVLGFGDGTLRIRGEFGPDYEIDLDPSSWVDSGCRVANTRFTPEESAVILPDEPVRPTCD
jgi:WD40 repeat protein